MSRILSSESSPVIANDLIQGLRDQKLTFVRTITHIQDITPVINTYAFHHPYFQYAEGMTVDYSALVAKCQLSAYGAISSKHGIDCKWGVCRIFTMTGEIANMTSFACM
jgi:hypothetical protein